MVTKWGLSDRLGPLTYSEDEGEVFLGRSVTQHKNLGDDTARIIDEEVRSLIDANYQRAETILKDRLDVLHAMTDALMKYETIDAAQIDALMAGEVVPAPKDWVDLDDDDNDSTSSSTSDKKAKKDSGDGTIGGPAGQH
jgi:cell division protease FtsH